MSARNGSDVMMTTGQSDEESGDTAPDSSSSSLVLFSTSYDHQASLSQSLLERRDGEKGDSGADDTANTPGGEEDQGERGRSSDRLTSHHTSAMMTRHNGVGGNPSNSAFFTLILISKVVIALLLAVILIGALTHLEGVGRVVKAVLAKVGRRRRRQTKRRKKGGGEEVDRSIYPWGSVDMC